MDEGDKQNADDRGERGQRRRLEKLQKGRGIRIDVHQADDLAGDGGTDVCADDDADRLVQGQDAGGDQTGGQHDGGRGTLDDGGDERTQRRDCW